MFIYLYFELNLWSYDPASVEFLTLIGYVNNNQKQPRFYFYKLMYRIAAAVFPWWGLLSNLFILFGVMHRVRQNGKVMKVFSFWYAPCSQPIELHDSLKSNVLKTHWGRRLQGDQRPCNFWNTCGFFFFPVLEFLKKKKKLWSFLEILIFPSVHFLIRINSRRTSFREPIHIPSWNIN